jgi:hypothetical protein|tara:strand:+ start:246 stop:662 length:417 start_codon:yes stop_codon:yes gene_type:complete
MVKTRVSTHAKINRLAIKTAITDIFGRTLTLRRVTRTVDAFGQLSARTTSDTSFIGDLQFGLDLDQRYISSGIVEVGEAVLFTSPDALSTLPKPQDRIVDGSRLWEIMDIIEAPQLGGTTVHYSYRCRRLIESGDQTE